MRESAGPFYRELGERIATARKKTRLTQERLAAAVGLSRTSVTNIEGGRQPVLTHVLVLIRDALGVTLDELVPAVSGSQLATEVHLKDLDAKKQRWVQRVLGSVEHGKLEVTSAAKIKSGSEIRLGKEKSRSTAAEGQRDRGARSGGETRAARGRRPKI